MPLPLILGTALSDKKNQEKLGNLVQTTFQLGFIAAMGLGSYFLLRKGYNEIQDDLVDRRSFQAQSPTWFATQLGQALNVNKWYGAFVDDREELFYQTLEAIPPKDWEAVRKEFRIKYHKDLSDVMAEQLSDYEYRLAMKMIEEKLRSAAQK